MHNRIIGPFSKIIMIDCSAKEINMLTIVCGWYTPDYQHWVDRLRINLDNIDVKHDFVEVEKKEGGWEVNTNQKPSQIIAALKRHPDKRIIFIDVDCVVLGTKEQLITMANISGDIGVHFRSRFRKYARGNKLHPRTGTMVFKSSEVTLRFLETWKHLSENAPLYTSDQAAFAVAMGRCPGVSLTVLDENMVSIPADKNPNPLILHDRGRTDVKKHWIVKAMIRAISR